MSMPYSLLTLRKRTFANAKIGDLGSTLVPKLAEPTSQSSGMAERTVLQPTRLSDSSPLESPSRAPSTISTQFYPMLFQLSDELKKEYSARDESLAEFLGRLISGSEVEWNRLRKLYEDEDPVVSKRTLLGTTISVMVICFL